MGGILPSAGGYSNSDLERLYAADPKTNPRAEFIAEIGVTELGRTKAANPADRAGGPGTAVARPSGEERPDN